jgi:hypothetical protein
MQVGFENRVLLRNCILLFATLSALTLLSHASTLPLRPTSVAQELRPSIVQVRDESNSGVLFLSTLRKTSGVSDPRTASNWPVEKHLVKPLPESGTGPLFGIGLLCVGILYARSKFSQRDGAAPCASLETTVIPASRLRNTT